MRKEIIGDATLYLGDCREIIPSLQGGVDTVVMDPPYGINLGYDGYEDSVQNLKELGPVAVELCLKIAKVVSVSPGNQNHYLYKQPTWTLCWFNRAGNGSGPWGFSCWQPLLCYGQDPYLTSGEGRRPDFIEWSEPSEKSDHPCPKPFLFMKQWISRVSLKGSILDPFMGSGTTLAAALQLNRQCIGIEQSPKYFDISCRKIENALKIGSGLFGI